MTPHPNTPRPTLDPEAIWTHLHAALNRRTPITIWTAIADIPVLLAELHRLTTLLTWTRTELANLLAAARATLAAHHDGEPDPLSYLRDQVVTHQAQPELDHTSTGRGGR
ncbi:MAG TPA: hypothetical protein VFM55_27110 [Micromonosporaceae bacterium]|nr:hypothetical protein [Micromonosporaceae bacterium]